MPPNPNVRPLDNCRKFRPFLPVGDPNRVDPAEAAANRRRRTEASIAAQALAKRRAEKFAAEGERARRREPVLARILDDQKRRGGPMALLARAVEQRLRVTIVTRHASGVRGKAEAYVKAFDRHANLILQDVRETYGVRVRAREEDPRERSGEEGGDADDEDAGEKKSGEGAGGAGSALGATPEPRRRPKMRLDRRERHVQQVFLRGEQVVSVSVPPAAGDGGGERWSEETTGGDAASSRRGGRGGREAAAAAETAAAETAAAETAAAETAAAETAAGGAAGGRRASSLGGAWRGRNRRARSESLFFVSFFARVANTVRPLFARSLARSLAGSSRARTPPDVSFPRTRFPSLQNENRRRSSASREGAGAAPLRAPFGAPSAASSSAIFSAIHLASVPLPNPYPPGSSR